jgi:PAS domain S-box-containing protein
MGKSDNPGLVAELEALRRRVAELEAREAGLISAHDKLVEQVRREHRQTEAALRLSEQKLAGIFAESPEAIAISSLSSGCYVEVNPAFERVFGYAREEVLGRLATELGVWPEPRDRERLSALLQERGEVTNLELRFRHKSGRTFDSLISASLIEIDGEPCMMSLTRDISERKRIEQLFLEQNRMLDALSRAQADFISDADPELTFSQLLSHLLDITDSQYGFIGEVLRDREGMPYLRAFAITDISWDEASRNMYQQYIKGNFEFRNLNTLFGHVMTSGRPVISNAPADDPRSGGLPHGHPPLDAFMGLPLHRAGQLVGMLGVANRPGGYDEMLAGHLQPFTNTSAVLIEAYRNNLRRHQAETLLRHLNEELENRVNLRTAELQASLKELESFSYSVSHDLRSPLRGINGYAQLLREEFGGRLGSQGDEYLQRIRAATLRMSELIDGMLDLAQLTRDPMHLSEVDLSHQAGAIARDLQRAEPGRQVEFDLAPGLLAQGDERLLHVVLQNLMSNAWKFTAKRKAARIEFGATRQGDATVYFISDNGAGFDMKYADKLFQPFERLHGMYEFSGTGIGLATVQRIIQRHGGRAWAEGEVGKGATFFFTLRPPPTSP